MAITTTETITKIQFRRGVTADRNSVNLSPGEPGWDTEQKILYIGTGDPSEGPGVPCIQFSSEFEVGTGGVKINFDDSTGTGFNFTSFLSGFNTYLENNATVTEKENFGDATAIALQESSSSVASAATATTLGVVKVPTTGGLTVDGGAISVKLGSGLKTNDSGEILLKTGDGVAVDSEGNLDLVIAPGLKVDENGIGLDTSTAGSVYILIIDGSNHQYSDDSNYDIKRSGMHVQTGTAVPKTVIGDNNQPFSTFMGAYAYALENLPRSAELEFLVKSESNWNDPNYSSSDLNLMQIRNIAHVADPQFNKFRNWRIISAIDQVSPSTAYNHIFGGNRARLNIRIDRTKFVNSAGQTTGYGTGASNYLIPLWFSGSGNNCGMNHINLHYIFEDNRDNSRLEVGVSEAQQQTCLMRVSNGTELHLLNVKISTAGGITSGLVNPASPDNNTNNIDSLIEIGDAANLIMTHGLEIDVTSMQTNGISQFRNSDDARNVIFISYGPYINKVEQWKDNVNLRAFQYDYEFPGLTSGTGTIAVSNTHTAGAPRLAGDATGNPLKIGNNNTPTGTPHVVMFAVLTIQDVLNNQ